MSEDEAVTPEATETPALQRERHLIKIQIECFAKKLARRYQLSFAHPHGTNTKGKVLSWLRHTLPPHPGAPRKPDVTLACKLRRRGTPWPEIARRCIERFDGLNHRAKRKAIRRLRTAYRGRLRLARSRRRKNSPPIRRQENNPNALLPPAVPGTVTP